MKTHRPLIPMELLRKAVALWLCFALLSAQTIAISPSDVISNPHGAGITQSGATTSVEVIASKSVLEWKNFDTSAAETLNFSSIFSGKYAVLNRVLSGSATQFDGRLNAPNGHIIVVNANGIVFGPSAIVNAYKFTASGLNLSNADFLSGNFLFSGGTGAIENRGSIQARDIHLIGSKILNSGALTATGGMLLLATGSEVRLAQEGGDIDVIVPLSASPASGVATGDITNAASGRIENPAGSIVMAAGDMFSMALPNLPAGAVAVKGSAGSINQRGIVKGGQVYMASKDSARIENTAVTAAVNDAGATGTMAIQAKNMYARKPIRADGDMTLTAANSISPMSDITAGGALTMTATAGAIGVNGKIQSGGDMNLFAGRYISLQDNLISGGTLRIKTIRDNTFSTANLFAASDIVLDTNLFLGKGFWDDGLKVWNGDQTVRSAGGRLTALGYIHKTTPGQLFLNGGAEGLAVDLAYRGDLPTVSNMGNIYIRGRGSVQIAGAVTGVGDGEAIEPDMIPGGYRIPAQKGGVSIISDFGSIFTRGADGLAIAIEGYSDDITHRLPGNGLLEPAGVVLPYEAGLTSNLAAIVVRSDADLKISDASQMRAAGAYVSAADNPAVGVDDRLSAGLLETPANIGGYDRDPGKASDIAMYFGSRAGDVVFNTPAVYFSFKNSPLKSRPTVVLDAQDTVSMPFLASLSGDESFGGFRLEAVSRRTEWLNEAIAGGRLPFASNPAALASLLGDDYVMRGAGLDNPEISDGRAWVLENMVVPAAPLPVLELPKLTGCPVELQAAAAELNISAEQLQMSIRDSLAFNPSIQPCQACADLLTAAAVLSDPDGQYLAAMNEVFNLLAPADAPFGPDVSAAVVSAFEQMGAQDRQFAMAANYVDAFVRYVAVINDQLRAPVGDPVAFALGKYGQRLTDENVNPNIAAYVLSELTQRGL